MKQQTARSLALLTATVMTASIFNGITIPTKAAESWIGDKELTEQATLEPEKDKVLPSKNQYRYQKDELAAFCHFGPNTFNEIEWGENYGNKTPDEIFKLEDDFDADNYVKALKEAGFKKLIVTAKHHDGFCIWASDYTTYDVSETSYKDGEGDILAEISAACTKYDVDMGLYLSPWDIHDESYGYYDKDGNPTTVENDYLDYNEYYNNQLIEILGDEKYGNDGHFVEVWMDGAKGSGQDAQDYDFVKWFDTIQKYEGEKAGYDSDCMLFGAKAYTTVRWIGNENGYADKNTWSKSKVNYDRNTIDSNSKGGYTIGYEDGNQWTVPEADARITSGWFWGTFKKTPKSIADLGSMYFGSVGNNATLLLNIPPNNKGTVDKEILDRVAEFGTNIKETFDDNLAAADGASVYADNVRGNDLAYKPGNTVDGDDNTYWTTDDGTNKGTLLISLGGIKTFDVVSVEEAIQNGQRINEYKIEYRNSAGEWTVMDSGKTIGAKRLCRSGAVKGDQVKITVSTTEGKVPMISEVGVYKASDGFELAGAAPDGMDVIDISNADHFTFQNGWTNETGPNFIGGTSKWAKAGASFTLNFKGTKVYLLGTKDPNHGTADVYIDDTFVETIDTNAKPRALGQVIFESDDLEDGTHTLRLEVKNKAIGIESAYVINNGGKGMVELDANAYTMNENTQMDVKLIRVGGSTGEVSVLVAPNPGSAIQDDFNTELITTVKFADGQTEATAPVETRRNTNQTGDRDFSIELTSLTEDLIIGFNDKAVITIIDTESASKEALQALVDEGTAAEPEWYLEGWDTYIAAITDGAVVLENESATVDEITAAISAITKAKEGLKARDKYTEDDPFVFPWREGSSATLEAEFASVLINDESNDGKGPWPLQVAEAEWASNGKFLNSLNNGDVAKYYFTAEKAGTYNVTAYYRSGSNTNALSWSSEPAELIEAGNASAGANDSAGATHKAEFTITVNQSGRGMLVLTGPQGNSPQLDKLKIVPKEVVLGKFTITATAGEHGKISEPGQTTVTEGDSRTYTITPDAGYKILDVKVNGESVGAVDTYTFENISADATIEAVFEFSNYTEDAPFYFPTDENGGAVTLEAEYSILNDVKLASDGQWALRVSEASWASNGKFVNCLNQQDTISFPYYAEKSGTYSFTAYYRSGDPQNALSWTEESGKITSGNVIAGANDSAGATHKVEFEIEVTEAGAGMLVFTGPDRKSPQLDKFDIILKEGSETPVVDKEALRVALEKAKTEAAKTDVYTAASIMVLNETIIVAQAVYDAEDATQKQVNAQVTALTDAIAALVEQMELPETFTITAFAGEGGTITPSGEVKVNAGETKTFKIEADEGWHIADVVVNGESVGAVETYKMDAAGTIEASFEKNAVEPERHQIKVNAGENGTITISGADGGGYVEHGKVVTFTVKADDGYVIDSLTVADGYFPDAVGKNSFEFTVEIMTDVIITATFKTIGTEPETPDKTVLEAALKDAAAILAQTEKYTADSLAEYQVAVDAAQAVLNNDQATAEDIEAAVKALEDAKGLLVEKSTETTDPGTDNKEKPSTGNTEKPSTGPDKPSDGNDKPQTGDTANARIWVFGIMAAVAVAAAGGVTIIIRRRNMK